MYWFISTPAPHQLNQPWPLQPSAVHREWHNIGCINQRVLTQVSVALGSLDLGVAKNLLHLIQGGTGMDEVLPELQALYQKLVLERAKHSA